MKVHDSRRFSGINVIWDSPGAVIEVELDGDATDDAIWARSLRRRVFPRSFLRPTLQVF
ncbi:MAG: hypothetical protein VCD33_04460 [Alphaproteobacteria bacterium]